MGLYINDPKMGSSFADKCDFIFKDMRGTVLIMGNIDDKAKVTTLFNHIQDKNEHAVVLVDNGPFAAAGLAPNFDEFERFMSSRSGEDQRRKILFSVPTHPIITKLLEENEK